MKEHNFTNNIRTILEKFFGQDSEQILSQSELLQYLNEKTVSANKGSKSRGSFANIYAIYVIIEDYINKGFVTKEGYNKYEGAMFSSLMKRQRELPFGKKLQNHGLNSRMNEEFKKFFPSCEKTPIVRDLKTQRYWINEELIKIRIGNKTYNIAESIIDIIKEYARTKQTSFERFVKDCNKLKKSATTKPESINEFLISLVAPEMDARLFEIVSYSILKRKYADQEVFWGFSETELQKESLKLYKTGRTNANDGGIDFVMKPLGRFFQVTETMDFKKYFLDIDKLEHYPITFVIKSKNSIEDITKTIRENAIKSYNIENVVNSYMDCIEEIINIQSLIDIINKMDAASLTDVLNEILLQSKVEFNQ